MKPGRKLHLETTGAIFAILFFLLTGLHSVTAQEPAKESPEVQQLKERLLQLEQTVNELKGQISTIEESKKNQRAEIIEATYKPDPPAAATAKSAPVPAKPKQDGEGESTFSVYGFAMLDAGYQFGSNHPNWFDVVRPTQLPSFEGEHGPDGKTYWGVRQSRLGVKSTTPTKWGELKTHFEFELFGTGVDAGQTTFRLRHAYGEIGQFGAGQTWSPFMDIDVFPNIVEYWGPNGMIFFRNVQFRWMPLKGKNAVTIALERPGASGDQGNFADRIELSGIRPKFDLPDLSGNVRFTRNWGHVQVAGILRRIKWVDTLEDDEFDFGGSSVGGGVSITSALNFTKKDVGRFSFVYGRGIQNYFNDAPVDVGPKIVENPGVGEAPVKGVSLPVLGIVAFLDHTWNKKFSTSFGYSMVNIENSNAQSPSAYRRGHYGIANLLYTPMENVMMGGELQWGKRENFLDGFDTDDVRIQFSVKYNFGKTFKY